MASRIRKGDQVIVITGRDKGKTGEVSAVMIKENKLIVQGINLVKRHTKPTQQSAGGIITKEAPIHVSNVSLIDPESGKATRVGFEVQENGQKVRVAKRSNKVIENKGKAS